MENVEAPEMQIWANKLKGFCEKYEEIMGDLDESIESMPAKKAQFFE